MKKGFNRGSIKKELTKRLKGFLDSIEDEEIKNIIRNKSIVTGGAIRECINLFILGELDEVRKQSQKGRLHN